MTINFMNTDEFIFHIADKSTNTYKDLTSNDPQVTISHPTRLLVRQEYAIKDGFLLYLIYFLKMYFFTLVRAFFLFRKSINEELAPIYIEAELETLSETSESTIIFEKSFLSSFDMLFVAPKLVCDRFVKVCDAKYFIDEYTVKVNRKKQFLRSISAPAMLFTLDAIVFTYGGIEEVFNVCAFCLYLLPFIALFAAFMVLRAKRAYKKYRLALDNQVGYMNGDSKKLEDKGL